ncbi:CocE/NonD family hydrolase [Mycobacteroides saopaulense]|uniref:Peptidase n=1 Tax=Mycobacteroides saopaulense TaxID=1578165 RepID=A0ABX3BX38_9MYCO|nr:CocE/NonD family hydrolase [Mycobacteroides saopaulense]OHT86480.1 peptidase [Mycobacteroides saopaulense]OHU08339.1 peptidase [Mycobacteroides saopaulense]
MTTAKYRSSQVAARTIDTSLAGASLAEQWTAVADGPGRYPRVSFTPNVSIPLADGTVLKAQVFRPADADGTPVGDRVPVLFNLTPYNKSVTHVAAWLLRGLARFGITVPAAPPKNPRLFELAELARALPGGGLTTFGVNDALIRSGYAQVVVDVRGTGASTGDWGMFNDVEQRDTAEVVAWARAQPWCDGTVGMYGISYCSINSLQAAGNRVPGLGAVFAVEPVSDISRDLMKTGGAQTFFLPVWMLAVALGKWLPSPSDVVRGGIGLGWLAGRLRAPLNRVVRYIFEGLRGGGALIDDDEYFRQISPRFEDIEIPTFVYGAWDDIFGPAALRIHRRAALPAGRIQVVINEGYHGSPGSQLGRPNGPPRLDVLQRAWFDKWLKGIDNGIDGYGPLTLQQQNGGWHTLDTYPRPEATPRRFYLDAEPSGFAAHTAFDGSLGGAAPLNRTEHLLQRRMGLLKSPTTSRMTAGITAALGTSGLKDSRYFERGALTFTSAAAEESWVISGPLNLHLRTKALGTEAFWVVSVTDVAPDGFSRMLAEGALLASRRGVDEGRSLRTADGDYLSPWHPTGKGHKVPVVPGVPMTLEIDLTEVDAVIAVGHRLRVVISAASLPRYIPSIPELWASRHGQSVVLDPSEPSYLVAQVVARPDTGAA